MKKIKKASAGNRSPSAPAPSFVPRREVRKLEPPKITFVSSRYFPGSKVQRERLQEVAVQINSVLGPLDEVLFSGSDWTEKMTIRKGREYLTIEALANRVDGAWLEAKAVQPRRLDDHGQPVCENCGEKTNRHYAGHPTLQCWKCGHAFGPPAETGRKP